MALVTRLIPPEEDGATVRHILRARLRFSSHAVSRLAHGGQCIFVNGFPVHTPHVLRAGDVLADEGLRREMGGGYDIVAANIVSDVIIALAPAVRGWMKEGGLFLTSGIIDARAGEVREKLEAAGFAVEEAGCSEGWYGFLCR